MEIVLPWANVYKCALCKSTVSSEVKPQAVSYANPSTLLPLKFQDNRALKSETGAFIARVSPQDKLPNMNKLKQLCFLVHSECNEQFRELANDTKQDKEKLPKFIIRNRQAKANMRLLVLCASMHPIARLQAQKEEKRERFEFRTLFDAESVNYLGELFAKKMPPELKAQIADNVYGGLFQQLLTTIATAKSLGEGTLSNHSKHPTRVTIQKFLYAKRKMFRGRSYISGLSGVKRIGHTLLRGCFEDNLEIKHVLLKLDEYGLIDIELLNRRPNKTSHANATRYRTLQLGSTRVLILIHKPQFIQDAMVETGGLSKRTVLDF